MPSGWFTPDWPVPAGVRALCTTREGGFSAAPFDSFNLGDHVRDAPADVARNRERLAAITAPARPVFLQQVHGTAVAHLNNASRDGIQADGCLANGPGLVATIMVADCLPVLLAHSAGRAVAAAHAGWRGLAAGVLENTVRVLREEGGAGDVLAWLGPCIGPAAFEVGPEVRQAFAGSESCFVPGSDGKYLADLPALARQRLQALGISSVWGNDGTPPWCTVTQASRFFSHRRDAVRLGSSGRMAACVWIE